MLAGQNGTDEETREAIALFLPELLASLEQDLKTMFKLSLGLVMDRMRNAVLCRNYTALQVCDRMWTVVTHPDQYFEFE